MLCRLCPALAVSSRVSRVEQVYYVGRVLRTRLASHMYLRTYVLVRQLRKARIARMSPAGGIKCRHNSPDHRSSVTTCFDENALGLKHATSLGSKLLLLCGILHAWAEGKTGSRLNCRRLFLKSIEAGEGVKGVSF